MGKVYIFSGAGLSAESGIPTFRTDNGYWTRPGIDINVVCNYQTWRKNYELVHQFYNERRLALANHEPNEAHKAIARWQEQYGVDNVVSITTNVDDLLERAGVKGTVHLHGNLTHLQDDVTGECWDIGYNEYTGTDPDVKPGVVMFYESAPEYQTLSDIVNYDMHNDDIIIFIGMSFEVVPAFYCVPTNRPIKVVNVNPDADSHYTYPFDERVVSNATAAVDRLDQIIAEHMAK